jgi:beta-lactamase class A
MTTTKTTTQVWERISATVDERPEGTSVAVTVFVAGSGETFSIDGQKDYASASTIKILILAAVARAFDAGTLHPTEKRHAPRELRLTGSGVVNWLDPDLELTLRDHAWLMTAISDNSSSNVCIDAIGIDAIGDLGAKLGTGATRLGRMFMGANAPAGPSKNRATTDGLVEILKAIENDTAASPEQCAWMRQCLDDQQHRDRLPRHLPEGIDYRGKTGTIEGIVHDCGVLIGPGSKVILAVLTEGFENPYDAERLIGRIGTAAAGLVA